MKENNKKEDFSVYYQVDQVLFRYQNEPKLNGVYSSNNLPKKMDGA